jgi:hypothetical protein
MTARGGNTSNWWVPSQPASNTPGSISYGGGGGFSGSGYRSDVIQYRSNLDAARAGHGQIGQAAYPDGYLGTLSQDRRQDKLLDAVINKLTDRSYQRGVHKGEKIDYGDYFWPDGFKPDAGLSREARTAVRGRNTIAVERYAPKGNPVERLAHLGKLGGLSAPEQENLYKQYGVSMAKNPIVINNPNNKPYIDKMRPRTAW